MRGRKPVPTALKVLTGNPGKRPLNKNEPKPKAKGKAPTCPKSIQNPEARKEWRRIVKLMDDLNMVTDLDRTILEMYCQVYARWIDTEAKIRSTGIIVRESRDGPPKLNPLLSVSKQCIEQLRQILGELGLTPSSRSRVSALSPKDDNDSGTGGLFE